MIYKDSKGTVLKEVMANEGDDLLTLAHEHDVDLEGSAFSFPPFMIPPPPTFTSFIDGLEGFGHTGACERSVACSTCHVILEPEMYDAIEEPTDEENDMLDLAFGLTDTYVFPCARRTPFDGGYLVLMPFCFD